MEITSLFISKMRRTAGGDVSPVRLQTEVSIGHEQLVTLGRTLAGLADPAVVGYLAAAVTVLAEMAIQGRHGQLRGAGHARCVPPAQVAWHLLVQPRQPAQDSAE